MDEEAGGTAGDDVEAGGSRTAESTAPLHAGEVGGATAADEIIDLPWDADLPAAFDEDPHAAEAAPSDESPSGVADDEAPTGGHQGDDALHADAGDRDELEDGAGDHDELDEPDDDAGDLGELDEDDRLAGRRNALPRRVESWRSRSASGAIATALAMGLQQVFEPEKRRPAAVAEAPSNPYGDDDPITVDYVPDDAPSTTVHVKPWLLEKGDPS